MRSAGAPHQDEKPAERALWDVGNDPTRDPSVDSEDAALADVEALSLKLAIGDRFERLGAIVQEHLLAGGRKFRARLALSVLGAFGVDEAEGTAWATACELLHNASLIHDDLQDRDELRRGKHAVWARHGEAQAINAGDLMLMLPFLALEHVPVEAATRWELTKAIAGRAEETVRGQSLEMTLLSTGRWDFASYAEAARGKTSALICLPVHGAAILAGHSPREARQISDAFSDLGLLFQMQDDVVDIFGDKGRKRGTDVRAGKVSILVVEHLHLHPDQASWLIPLLGKPRNQTTDEDVDRVATAFETEGALALALSRIETIGQEVLRSPVIAYEPALLEVARRLIEMTVESLRPLYLRNADS